LTLPDHIRQLPDFVGGVFLSFVKLRAIPLYGLGRGLAFEVFSYVGSFCCILTNSTNWLAIFLASSFSSSLMATAWLSMRFSLAYCSNVSHASCTLFSASNCRAR
jgi:hypothetical protein